MSIVQKSSSYTYEISSEEIVGLVNEAYRGRSELMEGWKVATASMDHGTLVVRLTRFYDNPGNKS